MKLFSYLKSLVSNDLKNKTKEEEVVHDSKEKTAPSVAKMIQSKEITEPMLTISQAAKKNGITRQAIFFAIKMKRLTAKRINDTWLVSESDLKEYAESKYSRSKSRNEGDLIFDKSKGFYSISEAAKYLGKNTNHIYYLVRMGKLQSHRQGTAIVIKDTELYKYSDFINKKSGKNLHII